MNARAPACRRPAVHRGDGVAPGRAARGGGAPLRRSVRKSSRAFRRRALRRLCAGPLLRLPGRRGGRRGLGRHLLQDPPVLLTHDRGAAGEARRRAPPHSRRPGYLRRVRARGRGGSGGALLTVRPRRRQAGRRAVGMVRRRRSSTFRSSKRRLASSAPSCAARWRCQSAPCRSCRPRPSPSSSYA